MGVTWCAPTTTTTTTAATTTSAATTTAATDAAAATNAAVALRRAALVRVGGDFRFRSRPDRPTAVRGGGNDDVTDDVTTGARRDVAV